MSRALLLSSLLLVACGGQVDSTPPTDGGVEAEVSPPDTLPKCCALGEPSCGCTVVATGEDGTCLDICDAKPVGWSKSTDAHGCPKWDVPAGSCLGAPLCPGSASTCPSGCGAVSAARYDALRDCVNVGSSTVGCIPADATCTGAITCKVRLSDGAVFRFGMGCTLDGWRPCTTAEYDKTMKAPYCEGIDAGGLPD